MKQLSKKRNVLRWFALIGVVVGAGASGTGWWVLRQTSHVPDFYLQAEKSLPAQVAEASQRLQTDVQQLQDDAAKRGSWAASFSDNEINAWLIEELPQKFPKLLASGARDPRVVIEDGRIRAAVRYTNHRIDTVISCEVEVELTEEPNRLAVRVKNLRAGALPLPLASFLKGITREAAAGGVDINWDFTEDGPVALVAVPSEHPNYVQAPVVVESVQLFAGQLVLSGHTGILAHESYEPRGSVHRFVSYRSRDKASCQTPRVATKSKTERM